MDETLNITPNENPPSNAMDTSEHPKTENQDNLEKPEIKTESKSEEEDKRAELNKNALIAVLQFLKKHNLQVSYIFSMLLGKKVLFVFSSVQIPKDKLFGIL